VEAASRNEAQSGKRVVRVVKSLKSFWGERRLGVHRRIIKHRHYERLGIVHGSEAKKSPAMMMRLSLFWETHIAAATPPRPL
jgi:hypothetical protein